MPLKTSFFNPTLFKKNLTRSWPLWGGVTAVGALIPLYLILALNSYEYMRFEREDFAEVLYGASVYFLPAFTCCYAILVAMFVWSYLHNSRSVGFMHSLSIDRTGLFVTNTLSGLAMLLIPYVVVGTLMCIVAACCGAMHVGAVMTTIAAVLFNTLLFFGMGTLCAHITGSVIAVGAYYVILNFAVPVMDYLINTLAQEFIFGLTDSVSDFSLWFAPVIRLYDKVDVVYRNYEDVGRTLTEIEGFWIIALYGFVGLAMLALSWYLYRIRRSESAGDIVAFKWLRPVFRFGIAFISAMTAGRVLYLLFWESLFGDGGRYADMIPMAVCMAISAVVGYYAASMLLEKTLRVFKGSLKSIAAVCFVTVLLCAAAAADIFGIEKYVPNVEDIESVRIYGYLDTEYKTEKYPQLVADIRDVHAAIVADEDYIRRRDLELWESLDGESVRWNTVNFVYTLKNGSTVERDYYVPITSTRMKDTGTYDGKLYAVVTSPEVLISSVTVPENAEIVNIYVDWYNYEMDVYENSDISRAEWEIIYSALCRDAASGSFVADSPYFWDMSEEALKEGKTFAYEAWIYVDYRYADEDAYMYGRYGNIAIQLQPTMTQTLNALKNIGIVDLSGWKIVETR